MSQDGEAFVVGVDVGGSKAHIRVESVRDRAVLAEEVLTNTGWAALGDEVRADMLAEMVTRILAGVGEAHQVAAVVAGVHGNDSPQQQAILAAPLSRCFGRVRVLNDSNLLVPAHGLASGTGVAAGTGSSATSIGADGRVMTVGGWGWVLGDEGGGVGLVRDAARQVLDAYDRQDDDPLCALLLAALDVAHPHGLSHHLGSTDPRLWAAATPAIFEAVEAGSARARLLVDAHAGAMAGMVELLARRGGDVATVVAGGGVLVNQPMLFEAFAATVRRRLGQGIAVVLLDKAPVAGAVNIAHQLAVSSNDSGKGNPT
ncbi:hypothetical protein VE25_13690 [Devosia geojensis]|uniref:ATPase BadF/BadG/BcrA/BcrD type domain-containing protein n=1 Tax=Devosia geojensis TaxID=443610 RepID=A0A0F5FRY6_9HYPH|nr:BadF/BadG/BcrA/BcrD ATPase family protein [Devosia geojensis]KKB11350.1 hypothetical protein VE25_13690 [Devosia geojensis]